MRPRAAPFHSLPLALALLTSCHDSCENAPPRPPATPTIPSAPPAPPPRPVSTRWHHSVLPVVPNGPLTAREIESVINDDHRLDICGQGTPFDLERIRVILRFAINADGRVGEITPVQPRPEAQSFRTCVIEAAHQWRFPASDTSSTTALLALEFTPEAQ